MFEINGAQNLSIISPSKNNPYVIDNDAFHIKFLSCRLIYCGMVDDNSKNHAIHSYSDHKHSFYEYDLTLSGNVTYVVDKKTVEVPPGSFIIFPPKKVHKINHEQANFSKISLLFDFTTKSDEHTNFYNFFERMCKNPQVWQTTSEIDYIAGKIATSSLSKENDYHNLILHYLALFFMETARAVVGDKYKTENEGQIDIRVKKAMEFVQMRAGVRVTVDDVAAAVFISTKQLTRLFKKEVGISPYEYIKNEKLKHVRTLLEETDLSLSEIADIVGYSSEYALNRAFTMHESRSAGKYRKDLRTYGR